MILRQEQFASKQVVRLSPPRASLPSAQSRPKDAFRWLGLSHGLRRSLASLQSRACTSLAAENGPETANSGPQGRSGQRRQSGSQVPEIPC